MRYPRVIIHKFYDGDQLDCIRVTENNEFKKTLTITTDRATGTWGKVKFKELKGEWEVSTHPTEDGHFYYEFTKIGASGMVYTQLINQ